MTMIDFQMLNQACITGINFIGYVVLSLLDIIEFDLPKIFLEFLLYIHEVYLVCSFFVMSLFLLLG